MKTIRLVVIVATIGLSACGNTTIPLPHVRDSDPVSQLNPDRWQATANDLMVPPGDGTPQPLPAPVKTGSNRVTGL